MRSPEAEGGVSLPSLPNTARYEGVVCQEVWQRISTGLHWADIGLDFIILSDISVQISILSADIDNYKRRRIVWTDIFLSLGDLRSSCRFNLLVHHLNCGRHLAEGGGSLLLEFIQNLILTVKTSSCLRGPPSPWRIVWSSTQQTPSTFLLESTHAYSHTVRVMPGPGYFLTINPLLSSSKLRSLCLVRVTIPLLSQKFRLTHLVLRGHSVIRTWAPVLWVCLSVIIIDQSGAGADKANNLL